MGERQFAPGNLLSPVAGHQPTQFIAAPYVVLIGAGNRRCGPLGPHGHQHLIGCQIPQQRRGRLGIEANIHRRTFELRTQVVQQTSVFGIRQTRKKQRATEAVAAFQQGHAVPPGTGHPRRLHTGRASADHHDMFGLLARRDDVLELVPGHGVDRAFDPLVDENLAHAHVAINARADGVLLVVEQLVGQVGVGQQFAGHGDEIAVATLQGGLCGLGFDAPDGNHRHVHAALEGRGPLHKAAWLMHQRRFGEHFAAGDAGAGRHTHRVHACRLGHARHCFGVLQINAAGGVQLLGIEPQPQREFGADPGAHRCDDLQQQAGAVFQRAAVLVVALVVIPRQEPGNDVAMGGMQFHAVKTRAFGALGGAGEPVGHLCDVGTVHDPDR